MAKYLKTFPFFKTEPILMVIVWSLFEEETTSCWQMLARKDHSRLGNFLIFLRQNCLANLTQLLKIFNEFFGACLASELIIKSIYSSIQVPTYLFKKSLLGTHRHNGLSYTRFVYFRHFSRQVVH